MVAAAARRPTGGLVPFDPFRHLGEATELIADAFAGELGPVGRHVLQRMRRIARWGGLGLLLWEVEAGALGAAGFVWLEDGHVVGNISLRRAAAPGGWMVGNVAVHPDWRGQGIGRALVEEAVQKAARRGAAWIGLEVRQDNDVAIGLYERMGFEIVGTMLELNRPAGLDWPPLDDSTLSLRKGVAPDSSALYSMAHEGLSRPHQQVLEIRHSSYRPGWESWLSALLGGRCERWRVAEGEGRIAGAVQVATRWSPRWHSVEVLAREERLDDLGPQLARAGISLLSRCPPWETTTLLPGPREALEPVFRAAGFRRARRLIQMRLSLARPVRITPQVSGGGNA